MTERPPAQTSATALAESQTRFAFGENWSHFLKLIDEDRIRRAQQTLSDMLGLASLEGKSFLDIGSGSGLFSLAAHRMGAKVHSFDYDPQSVECTRELKKRFAEHAARWTIEQGSVLDTQYVQSLGTWDVVYSWGVLHHTGQMWQALDNVAPLVTAGGALYLAIYNDQGLSSRLWHRVKRVYNALPRGLRWLVLGPALVRLWGPTTLRDLLRGRPFHTWRNYSTESSRGMSPWRDVVDWVGGLPFEVARPEQVVDFYRQRGFEVQRLVTCGRGQGCNEFVFQRT